MLHEDVRRGEHEGPSVRHPAAPAPERSARLERVSHIPSEVNLSRIPRGHRAAFAIVAGDGMAPDVYAGNAVTIDLDRQPEPGELAVYTLADGSPVVAWHRGEPPAGARCEGAVCSIGWDPKTPRPGA